MGEARERLREWWPAPAVLVALALAPEGKPFEIEVDLGGVPSDVWRWLNPLVLRAARCRGAPLAPTDGTLDGPA